MLTRRAVGALALVVVALGALGLSRATAPTTGQLAAALEKAPPIVDVVEPSPESVVEPLAENETLVAYVDPSLDRIWPVVEPESEERVPLEFAITNPTFWGNQLTLRVIDRTPDGEWLKVQIPVRPNGTEGWIEADGVELTSHFVHARVDLTSRSVTVWDDDEVIAETAATIGTEATPTPVGEFFVNDLVEKFEGSAFGPYILTISAFSETLETFAGGIPVIAIHGTNRPDLMGGAHSNGCIRVPNDVITFLAEHVPMGTPVEIVA